MYIPSFQARVPLISVLKAGGKNNNSQNPLYGNLLNNNASLLRKVNSVPGKRKPLQFHTPETNNIGRLGISVLAQRVPGSFGWTRVTYDRLMVALDTIHQPKNNACPPIPEIVAPKTCTHSPYSFWCGDFLSIVPA